MQCCYKRAAPSIVFKLDFSKAFDCINWESLRVIALARGSLSIGVIGWT